MGFKLFAILILITLIHPCRSMDWKGKSAQEYLSEPKPVFENHHSNSSGDMVVEKTYLKEQVESYVLSHVPLDEDFVVFDFGGGRGHNSLRYLELGATVIIYDRDHKALCYAAHQANPEWRNRLWLIEGEFPNHFHLPNECINLFICFHIFHYQTRMEINQVLEGGFKALKSGYRSYITALTPWSQPFFFVQEEEDKRFKSGEPFPGEFENLTAVYKASAYGSIMLKAHAKLKEDGKEAEPGWAPVDPSGEHHPYNSHMPNFGHPLRVSTVERLAKQCGYNILCSNYFDLTANIPPDSDYNADRVLEDGLVAFENGGYLENNGKEIKECLESIEIKGRPSRLFDTNPRISTIGIILEKSKD